MVCYCSNNCRVAGTAEHRLECLILTRSGNKRHSLSDHIRLIMRIWLRIRSEGVHRVERADTLSKCWDYLVDHTKALEVSTNIRKIKTTHDLLSQGEGDNKEILEKEYSEMGNILNKADMPSLQVFINIYSKILVNSFSLRSDR